MPCRIGGTRLNGRCQAFRQNIRDFVMVNHPEYATAPEKYTVPNMTSWKYYKKVMEERKKQQ